MPARSAKNPNMIIPDYQGGSIVNLMATIEAAMGGSRGSYPGLTGVDPGPFHEARNILLLVIDGLGHDYLLGQAEGEALRNDCLQALTSVVPATTAAAIPAFLTGLPPQQHGFTGWFTYFCELGTVLTVLPFTTRLGQLPLPPQVPGPRELSGATPLPDRLQAESHLFMPAQIAGSRFTQAFCGRGQVHAFNDLAGLCADLVIQAATGRKRQFLHAYWPELDTLAHLFGVGSRRVARHLAELGGAYSRLVEGLRGTDTLLVVTADHGLVDVRPEETVRLEEHPVLAQALSAPLCGEPRMAFCYIHPGRVDGFEAYVRDRLGHAAWLYPSRELLEAGWFGLGEPHPRLQERIGHYTLVMREGWRITGELPGERPMRQIGVHGGVSRDEMRVPLVMRIC